MIKAHSQLYYYPGHRIQKSILHQSALSPLTWGAFRPVAILQARTMPGCSPQYRSHPISGSPFNTWVKSMQQIWIKLSCLKDKSTGRQWDSNPRHLNVRVERSHHYTMAPPLYRVAQIRTFNSRYSRFSGSLL